MVILATMDIWKFRNEWVKMMGLNQLTLWCMRWWSALCVLLMLAWLHRYRIYVILCSHTMKHPMQTYIPHNYIYTTYAVSDTASRNNLSVLVLETLPNIVQNNYCFHIPKKLFKTIKESCIQLAQLMSTICLHDRVNVLEGNWKSFGKDTLIIFSCLLEKL